MDTAFEHTDIYVEGNSTYDKLMIFPGANISIVQAPKKKKRTPRSVTNNKTVDPISDKKDVAFAIEYISNRGTWHDLRDCCLFVLGINLGMRCGDLIKLRVKDVFDENNQFKPLVWKEKKTGKLRYLYVNKSVQLITVDYLKSLPSYTMETYLFASRKKSKNNGEINCHIGVKAVNDLMKDLQYAFKNKYNLGSHSMRKTFGRHIFMDNQDSPEILAYLMKIFKHSSQETTLRYIGLESEKEKDLYMNHNLGLCAIESALFKEEDQDINNIKNGGD